VFHFKEKQENWNKEKKAKVDGIPLRTSGGGFDAEFQP